MTGTRAGYDPDDGLDFDKPFAQMTRDELAEAQRQVRRKIRELQQPARDAKLRRGVVKPKTGAEREIFGADWRRDADNEITRPDGEA
jgi:hypothetical protein